VGLVQVVGTKMDVSLPGYRDKSILPFLLILVGNYRDRVWYPSDNRDGFHDSVLAFFRRGRH